MTTRPLAFLSTAGALLFALTAAQAQTTPPPRGAPPAPPLSPTEQTISDIKNPASWMSWGADARLRNEYLDNTLTLNPDNPLAEQDYFRYRLRQ